MIKRWSLKIVLFTFIIVLLLIVTAVWNKGQAQYDVRVVDSVKRQLNNAEHDSARFAALQSLASIYQDRLPDSSIYFGEKIIALGLKNKDEEFLNRGYGWIGRANFIKGNYALALQMQFKALQIIEQMDDSSRLANMYNSIGNTYKEQGDFEKSKTYYQSCKNIAEKIDDHINLEFAFMNLAYVYEKTNQIDSALLYGQQAYDLGIRKKYTLMFGFVLQNLGTVHLRLGNKQVAENFYRMAIDSSASTGFTRTIAMNFLAFAHYFNCYNQPDSAILYAKKALSSAKQGSVLRIEAEALKFLSEVYDKSNKDSAFLYQKVYIRASDSLNNRNKIAQVESLNYTEQLRQQEKRQEEEKAKEERVHNLQYAAIALGLVSLLISFLVLSHTVIVGEKLIRFLGVVSLLIVFEFLNLLLHPWMGELTHHSPILMLVIMVCVAALLVPLHHKLEHWVIHRIAKSELLLPRKQFKS